jgi:hypothetical protein
MRVVCTACAFSILIFVSFAVKNINRKERKGFRRGRIFFC